MTNEVGGRLHVLTEAGLGPAALEVVSAALDAGAPVVQVRGKGVSDAELYDFTVAVVELCARSGARCIVNDRVDIAIAAGAHGTHLGAGDLPVAAARRLAGPGHLLGGTARYPQSALALVRAGADYVGVGPAYATTTKAGLPDPIGPDGIGAVARAVTIPVIAIGGITADRVAALTDAGAYGIAVVGAVSAAPDPAEATRSLLAALGATP